MLNAYACRQPVRFHMPGHKGRMPFAGGALDVTELTETDNLALPGGALAVAQQAAASAWHAGLSRLLVNGSTAGIQAMLLWCKAHGLRVVLPRDMHVSAAQACALFDIQPVWVWPGYDDDDMLARCPEFTGFGAGDAIFVTYPDYYGRCAHLARIQEANPGALLLCDAAHGAHFAFYDGWPPDAGAAGADAWVAGIHKTLPAPTQTALLHVNNTAIMADIDLYLQAITTTSPSFWLLCGADDARVYMQTQADALAAHAQRCMSFVDACAQEGWECLGQDWAQAAGFAGKDALRIVIDTGRRGLSGWEAAWLLAEQDIFVEMGDARRLVLVTSPLDTQPDYDRLLAALIRLPVGPPLAAHPVPLVRPVAQMSLHAALFAHKEWVDLAQAPGRIAARPFGAYPPGLPLCVGGEPICAGAVDTIRRATALGGSVYGLRENQICVVK
ncbi:MAG: hypothetical protein PHO66_07600 [Eubacteriales bacterium]|nr:hypothetical protein [Eubacteriales bacterium]